MLKIHKKILTDEHLKPIAVQIDYADWLQIERILQMKSKEKDTSQYVDLSSHQGTIQLKEEPLAYQKRLREEWA